MLTIWGRATSLNVQAVMWTVAELGLPHRRIDWGGRFGGNDDIDYRAMNPNGLVPTIRDGEVVVWESPAIVRYLGARYGCGAFWPEDPAARAPLDMWAEWARSSVYPALTRIFIQLVRTREPARDMTEVAAGAEALIALLPRLEARLGAEPGGGPWLCGQQPCFADVMVGHLLYRYMTLDFVKGPTPAIDAWYARLTRRPAFAEHVMVSYESLRPA